MAAFLEDPVFSAQDLPPYLIISNVLGFSKPANAENTETVTYRLKNIRN